MQKEAKEKIKLLVEKYEKVKTAGRLKSYTEEETKKDFILPLFEALGWDIYNKNEVSAEESMSSGRVDYGFYLNGHIKFYLEAKKLSADLRNEDFANQTVRYSWNKGATWALLSDFESIIVFNAQDIKRSLADKLYFEIPYTEYLNRFDQLWLLSKTSFQNDLLDKDAEIHGKKFQKIPVTTLLYEDLEKCRGMLTKDLGDMNEKVSPDLLDEGVQKLLDRLIFIRVAEDRGVEDKILVPLAREARSGNGNGKLYESMVKKFREFDSFYNSNLFSTHPFEQWEEYSGVTERVINILYGKAGYYEYDFKAMPADVLGAVYESYLGHRLAKSKKGLTVAKDAGKRKEHGIYYTPSFIVDYIVKNALGPVLDKCNSVSDLKKIKILDPACGSGSFLIKAFNVIAEKYKSFGAPDNEMLRIQILEENIYGVDLDPQAVEITRLNLLINALNERMKLPLLDNIKNNNSLLMDWKEEFPEIFRNGGFDVIIGNPPYGAEVSVSEKDYLRDKLPWASKIRETNTFVYFIENSMKLLKEGGGLGFIIPDTIFYKIQYQNFREYLLNHLSLSEIVETGAVFEEAKATPNALVFIKNNKPDDLTYFSRKTVDFRKQIIHISDSISSNKFYEVGGLTYSQWGKSPLLLLGKYLDKNKLKIISKIISASNNLGSIKNIQIDRGLEGGKSSLKTSGKYLILIPENVDRYFIDHPKYYTTEYKESFKYDRITIIRIRSIQLKQRIIAALEKNKRATLKTLQQVYFNGISDYKIEFLLGIINSKLINFYCNNFLVDDLNKEYLEMLPIINLGENMNKQEKLVKLVKAMLDLNKNLEALVENSEKWQRIKSEIEKIDKKIDEEVYKLYGLTPEEIKIIESAGD